MHWSKEASSLGFAFPYWSPKKCAVANYLQDRGGSRQAVACSAGGDRGTRSPELQQLKSLFVGDSRSTEKSRDIFLRSFFFNWVRCPTYPLWGRGGKRVVAHVFSFGTRFRNWVPRAMRWPRSRGSIVVASHQPTTGADHEEVDEGTTLCSRPTRAAQDQRLV
jgi:hypothetical protein